MCEVCRITTFPVAGNQADVVALNARIDQVLHRLPGICQMIVHPYNCLHVKSPFSGSTHRLNGLIDQFDQNPRQVELALRIAIERQNKQESE
jgi:hypothetical protein